MDMAHVPDQNVCDASSGNGASVAACRLKSLADWFSFARIMMKVLEMIGGSRYHPNLLSVLLDLCGPGVLGS